jgi:cytoskeletal protein CcmA (bactofilin family)
VIDGEVKGTITSKGELTIGEHGRIKAEVRVGSVTIYGSVEGNVFATERCAVEAGGSLRGDVESPRLGLNENASFSGSAKISSNRG